MQALYWFDIITFYYGCITLQCPGLFHNGTGNTVTQSLMARGHNPCPVDSVYGSVFARLCGVLLVTRV